jgi:hypothetical protein
MATRLSIFGALRALPAGCAVLQFLRQTIVLFRRILSQPARRLTRQSLPTIWYAPETGAHFQRRMGLKPVAGFFKSARVYFAKYGSRVVSGANWVG